MRLKDPITGETVFFRQHGPLYGEKSAPVLWEETLAPFLESIGLKRGSNDKCIYTDSATGLRVLLYVDDLFMKHQDRFLMVGKAPAADGEKAATYL